MRGIAELLDAYGESHRHPLNKLLHWLCVPVIFWTVVALLWSLPSPADWRVMSVPLNWAVIAMALVQAYYFRLSAPLALGFLVVNIAMLALAAWASQALPWPLWQFALALFVVAWIGQFIGHAVEGKRPSLFRDLQFLLIGPAWLLAAVFSKAGYSVRARRRRPHSSSDAS